jgi:hypothetical protein
MLILERETERFWSDTYCGRPIAILNRGSGWHIYLDHVLQHNIMFETAEKAIAWLEKRIDQDKVSNRGRKLSGSETRQVPIMRPARTRRSTRRPTMTRDAAIKNWAKHDWHANGCA